MFVWKTTNIIKPPPLNLSIGNCSDYYEQTSDGVQVGIIGFGPKGLYALASLVNNLKNYSSNKPAFIHIFNSHRFFAAGPNYSPDQPEYLLINYSIDHISAWKEEEMVDSQKLRFLDWIAHYNATENLPNQGDFASRALVGLYLQDTLRIVLENLPSNVSVLGFNCEITGCQIDADQRIRLQLDQMAFHPVVSYSSVILTTGHSFPIASTSGLESNPFFIDHIYPTQNWLGFISNYDKIAVSGLGLTAFDAILALTEGKGGEFIDENGSMSYVPSGREPSEIHAFSRSGLPMIPRTGYFSNGTEKLESFNSSTINLLKKKHGAINFEFDILPLIRNEMETAWYESLVKRGPKPGEWFSLFCFQKFINPLSEECFYSGDKYQIEMENLLQSYVDDISQDPEHSLLVRVTEVWRKLPPFLTECYNFGGFSPKSKSQFENIYLGRFNQISFGPPLISMRKILCLTKQGIIKFQLGRSPKIESIDDNKFFISSSENGQSITADYLIQARIPKNQFPLKNSSLYEDLYKRGLACQGNSRQIQSNCPLINYNGQLIARNGLAVPQITLYGTPTEGITLDNDSLSRIRNDFGSPWAAQVIKELSVNKTTLSQ
jgi:hypothetical protein